MPRIPGEVDPRRYPLDTSYALPGPRELPDAPAEIRSLAAIATLLSLDTLLVQQLRGADAADPSRQIDSRILSLSWRTISDLAMSKRTTLTAARSKRPTSTD